MGLYIMVTVYFMERAGRQGIAVKRLEYLRRSMLLKVVAVCQYLPLLLASRYFPLLVEVQFLYVHKFG